MQFFFNVYLRGGIFARICACIHNFMRRCNFMRTFYAVTMRVLVLLVCLWNIGYEVIGQQVYRNHAQAIPVDLIVRLKPAYTVSDLRWQVGVCFPLLDTSCWELVPIWERLGLWQVRVHCADRGPALRFTLKGWQRLPAVDAAIENRPIEWRRIPDDPQFDKQWHLYDPQTMVDLDMPVLWDVDTGGITAAADTIVVCIIDGGFDYLHEDLLPNQWINLGEVPDNGIDDDGNGYVDDYLGWNVATFSDDIRVSTSHGTRVAGLIGARGNNGKGVAGINWRVKLMYVAGISDIASVLRAFRYPYGMRKLYNETGGAAGAFVVAINASWGIPNLFPEDVPIWCALYDSLGAEGILTVAAAPNRYENVDSVGDMPALCSSDYLLVVTNLDRQEQFRSAGYSLRSVDLAAIGSDVWTTAPGHTYKYFGGTSAATAIVSGAVAFLYAWPTCNPLAALSRTDPPMAVLRVKSALMDGVRPIASLQGKCVSGGRLDLKGAIAQLQPLWLRDIRTDAAIVDWPYFIRDTATVALRSADGTTADTLILSNPPDTIASLRPCSWYSLQVLDSCPLQYPTTPLHFRTDGCCDPPSIISWTALGDTAVLVSWTSVSAAERYHIQFIDPLSDDTLHYDFIPTDSPFIAGGLSPCTDYRVLVRSQCGDSTSSAQIYAIRTLGCGACLDLSYCTPGIVPQAQNDHFQRLYLDSVVLLDSPALMGYALFSQTIPSIVQRCDNVELKGVISYPDNYAVALWLDADADGQFSPSERLAIRRLVQHDSFTLRFALGDVVVGERMRLRIAVKYLGFDTAAPLPCGENIEFGQVLDFCLRVVDSCQKAVQHLVVDTSTTGRVAIRWSPCSAVDSYFIHLQFDGWDTSFSSLEPSVLVEHYPRCQRGQLSIRGQCADGEQTATYTDSLQMPCGTYTTWGGSPPKVAFRYVSPYLYIDLGSNYRFDRVEVYGSDGRVVVHQAIPRQRRNMVLSTHSWGAGVFFIVLHNAQGRRIVNKLCLLQ